MPVGGTQRMSGKMESRKIQQPRILTTSEIRARVEEIADELARKIGADSPEGAESISGVEAIPIDTRRFVVLMSEFIHMN